MWLSVPIHHSQSKPDFCQDSFFTNFRPFYTQISDRPSKDMSHFVSRSSCKPPMALNVTQDFLAYGVLPTCPCYCPGFSSHSVPHPAGIHPPCPLPQHPHCALQSTSHSTCSSQGQKLPFPLQAHATFTVRPLLVTLLKTVPLPLPQTSSPSSVLL